MIRTIGNCKYEINFELGKVYNLRYNKKRELTCKSKNGYIYCNINNKKTMIHRFIVECYHNKLFPYPQYEIDHINNIKNDNRISNLRAVEKSKNQQNRKGAQKNSKSQILGVYFHKRARKWICYIKNPETKKLYYKTCSSIFHAQIHRKFKEFEYNKKYVATFKNKKTFKI